MRWKLILLVLFLVLGAGGVWGLAASGWSVTRVQGALRTLAGPGSAVAANEPKPREAAEPKGPWDGLVTIGPQQREAIGLQTATVVAQDEPTRLDLIATTDYDPNTLNVIRPPIDLRVDKVYKIVGDRVTRGEPLLDVFSNALAEAKTAVEKEYSEWQHDLRLLESRRELYDRGAITRQAWADIVNDEAKSNLEYKLARDKLLVYGLSEKEIEHARKEDGSQKAMMTIRAHADGLVIKRDVVPGNLYKPDDELLVIAPLDRLWVHVSVPEGDAPKVQLRQHVRVICPYNALEFEGEVEHIYNQVDPVTRSVRFRTSIPNDEGRLQAGMYVRTALFLPPKPGRTIVPRSALVTADGANDVFVRDPGDPGKFARRAVQVIQEGRDAVILGEGVRAGEVVATRGSLILAQLYEDLAAQQ